MTLEELNVVRKLKKKITDEAKKLKALETVIESFPHKYGNEEGGKSGGVAKSAFEFFVITLIDCETKIENLQSQLQEEAQKLTKKIQAEFEVTDEQILLIYRYVACKSFHEVSRLMHYSLRMVYKVHERIIKNVQSSSRKCS